MSLSVNLKLFLPYLLLAFPFLSTASNTTKNKKINTKNIYEKISNKTLSFQALDFALKGLENLQDSIKLNTNIISVLDFSQPSNQKRFYLIDIYTKKVLYQDYVAHGKNTGGLMAKNFSNTVNSYKSSLGFYKTAETYVGKHGLSLRLDGLEKGINDQARQRAIVMHAADYAEEKFINNYGRLGRSFGCPALPTKNYSKIINLIKNGTLLFIYAPQQNYLQNSAVLNGN